MLTRQRHRPAAVPSRSYASVPAPEGAPLPSLRFVYLDSDTTLRMQTAGCGVLRSSLEVEEASARLREIRDDREVIESMTKGLASFCRDGLMTTEDAGRLIGLRAAQLGVPLLPGHAFDLRVMVCA